MSKIKTIGTMSVVLVLAGLLLMACGATSTPQPRLEAQQVVEVVESPTATPPPTDTPAPPSPTDTAPPEPSPAPTLSPTTQPPTESPSTPTAAPTAVPPPTPGADSGFSPEIPLHRRGQP